MKKIVFLLLFGISTTITATHKDDSVYAFTGEKLNYKIKYGWFKVGQAQINIDSTVSYFDDEPHYYVSFKLKTSGVLKVFANLDLHFDSYVHSETFKPLKSRRLIKNGKKENNQYDDFIYGDTIHIDTYRESRDELKRNSYESEGKILLDALSTYLYIRHQKLNMDRDEELRFYIADDVFDFRMTPNRRLGKGKVKSYEMIFPPIKEFPKKKTSYTFFNDDNVPVEMKIGTNNGNFFLVLED